MGIDMTQAQYKFGEPGFSTIKGLVRVGVSSFIVNNSGQALMCHRTTQHGNGTWASPGGHIEHGEHPINTARREALEEVGLEIINPCLVGLTCDYFTDKDQYYLTPVYISLAKNPESLRNMEPEKCDDMKWLKPRDFPDNLFLSTKNFIRDAGGIIGVEDIIKKYLQKLKN